MSCSSELERLDLAQQQSGEVLLQCANGEEIQLFVDVEMEFVRYPQMVMDFEFYKGKELIQKGGIDPLSGTIDPSDMNKGSAVKDVKFYAKLEGTFQPQKDTIYAIKPTLIYNDSPDLKIKKFELVFVR